ncbi:MAG: hypothetical protein MI725_03700 [Pirellulales bacterium]|nr:hypothetical protein [Pirellulales bacterium]
MRGGLQRISHASCARRSVGVACSGILSLLVLFSEGSCRAHEGYGDEHCQRDVPGEQSIIVSTGKADIGESTIAIATDHEDQTLEPIANVSERVPDLADSAGPVPDLANPSDTEAIVEDAPAEQPTDVISFEGVTPGISHRREVFQAWGDPRSEETTAVVLKFRFEKFESVKASFDGDVVDAIAVRLDDPLPIETLINRLNLKGIHPAELTDENGVVLAQAYPERGVVLRLAADQPRDVRSDMESDGRGVKEIVIQSIKAEAFILRAENEFSLHPSQSLQDLKVALQLDPTSAHANWLLAELEMKRGKVIAAERYAAEATEHEAENLAFRLQWARSLRLLARYDRAVKETRAVLQTPSLEPLIRAEALYEMGMLASLGSQDVAKSAVPLHQKAIEIADKLAAGEDPQVGRAANKLLVEAHLAIAVEIARGSWEQKEYTVPKWIERASALAEGLIAEDESQLKLRLQVAVSALAAAASLDKPIDPLLWIEEAEQTAKLLRKASNDPISRDQINWNLGLAYFQAAQIEHRRSEPESALRLGKLADAKLNELAKGRDELPDTGYLMGRLYFQIGAVHAVHEDDHHRACQWYDDAADRLLNPVPVTTMATPQQHGDALVSMGVSYWEIGNRQQAVKITESGVKLIEQAVSSGLLGDESLIIPYGNLAAMYEAQGKREPAARYTKLAQKLSNSQR